MSELKKGKAHKLGEGSLKFGATGSEIEFGIQCKSVEVVPDVEDDKDDSPVLSGELETTGSDSEESYTLKGELYQDYSRDSLITWCHVNAGTSVPFIFKPNNDHEMNVRGEVRIRRLAIGGDVKDRNTSDFEFKSTRKEPYQLFADDEEITKYGA